MILGLLIWLAMAAWLVVSLACFFGGLLFAIAPLIDSQKDWFVIGLGWVFAIGGAISILLWLAVYTGEINLGSSLLPDGCYRVGHMLQGKVTVNTFDQIAGCR